MDTTALWQGNFNHSDIFEEICAGNPLILGFASGPYGGAHSTVCVGYEALNGKVYVYLSDGWVTNDYAVQELNLDTYNDYICKVRIVVQ